MDRVRGLTERLFEPAVRRSFLALWAAAWLVVAVLLLMPVPGGVPEGADKVVHFLIFAGLASAPSASATAPASCPGSRS